MTVAAYPLPLDFRPRKYKTLLSEYLGRFNWDTVQPALQMVRLLYSTAALVSNSRRNRTLYLDTTVQLVDLLAWSW